MARSAAARLGIGLLEVIFSMPYFTHVGTLTDEFETTDQLFRDGGRDGRTDGRRSPSEVRTSGRVLALRLALEAYRSARSKRTGSRDRKRFDLFFN